ncbi:YheC/YheD family protein [Gorillibacterium massiliense]|uniref:YheC/YheD family protein n=1 Tax=Gorillibacterium massiliense TaxID=1280390 RepID=UPI0004B69A75|nr:YheC/YheD family protein [Gorillibacterium massiliense]
MVNYQSRTITSKWTKTEWLLQNPSLSKYVPKTELFTRDTLRSMLAEYPVVYFKPTNGSGGHRIIRIKRLAKGYSTQHLYTLTRHSNQNRLFNHLDRFSKGQSYLLQAGIQLATSAGKPFDIRVMAQKNNAGTWVGTAIFVKVGRPGKVATNYHQGGTIALLRPTLKSAGYSQQQTKFTEDLLKQLGVDVGYQFDLFRKGFRELGLDVALDSTGKPWILEVNTSPQIFPLKVKPFRPMYRKILSYAKDYGRTK